jgi:hypothetical protein
MKSIKVTFTYSTNVNDYTIEAVVTPGAKSVRGQFDRFQEPDDDDTAEITEVTDEDGVDHIAEFVFTGKQIREIEAVAIEKAAEESEPEYED